MELYNISQTTYSSSTSSDFSSYTQSFNVDPKQNGMMNLNKPEPSFLSSLHSIRKPMLKPMLKKPIAPLPPTPPRVYKVDSTNFKQVVQKLTSDSQNSTTRRLQDVAPPPLNISSASRLLRSLSNIDTTINTAENEPQTHPSSYPSPLAAIFRDLMDENIFDSKPSESFGEMPSPFGFNLTPNFCSFLNETLDSSASGKKSMTSSDNWSALLSPLGISNFSPTINSTITTTTKLSDCFEALSPLGFNLSPASAAWCSLALASPGALSPMGQTTVL